MCKKTIDKRQIICYYLVELKEEQMKLKFKYKNGGRSDGY